MAIREGDPNQIEWPPRLHDGESDVERKARLKAEAEAKSISDKIDKEIDKDRVRREREAGPKILLLGWCPVPISSWIQSYFPDYQDKRSRESRLC